jgi:hypothetical protein
MEKHPRSGQSFVVVPLAREIINPLDSGLRRNDVALSNGQSRLIALPGCRGGFEFAFQGVDLALDRLELGFLAFQEGEGDAGFFLQPGGGEEVGVVALVGVLAEVAELDQALLDRRAQAVVGLAQG